MDEETDRKASALSGKKVQSVCVSNKEKAPTAATVEAWKDEKLKELFQNEEKIATSISIVIQCRTFIEQYCVQAKIFQKICKKRTPTAWELGMISEKSYMALSIDQQFRHESVRENWDSLFPVKRQKFRELCADSFDLVHDIRGAADQIDIGGA